MTTLLELLREARALLATALPMVAANRKDPFAIGPDDEIGALLPRISSFLASGPSEERRPSLREVAEIPMDAAAREAELTAPSDEELAAIVERVCNDPAVRAEIERRIAPYKTPPLDPVEMLRPIGGVDHPPAHPTSLGAVWIGETKPDFTAVLACGHSQRRSATIICKTCETMTNVVEYRAPAPYTPGEEEVVAMAEALYKANDGYPITFDVARAAIAMGARSPR